MLTRDTMLLGAMGLVVLGCGRMGYELLPADGEPLDVGSSRADDTALGSDDAEAVEDDVAAANAGIATSDTVSSSDELTPDDASGDAVGVNAAGSGGPSSSPATDTMTGEVEGVQVDAGAGESTDPGDVGVMPADDEETMPMLAGDAGAAMPDNPEPSLDDPADPDEPCEESSLGFERCDGVDNDCDEQIDEGACDASCFGVVIDGVSHQSCSSTQSRAEAAAHCVLSGMVALNVQTPAENTAAVDEFFDEQASPIWTSAVRVDGRWMWSGLVPVEWSNWAAGEPSGGDCMVLTQAGTWDAVACEMGNDYRFVCEAP